MNSKKIFWAIGISILILGGFLRFYKLTDRPFHHDESMHAYYSYQFETQGEYRYNPMLHGPFLFYADALVFKTVSDSDFTARLLPACFGILLIYLCLCLYPYIGKPGALFSAFLICISPTMVYFSRFLRNDIYIAVFSLGILLSVLKYRETRKEEYWYIASALLALAFCSKENTYFVAFSFITFGILYWLYIYRAEKYLDVIKQTVRHYWQPICTTFFIFWIVYIPFYTVFFHYPQDWNGFYTGIKYWFHQHEIQRIGAPWWYYLPFFGIYEFLPVIVGILALIYIIRKRVKESLVLFLLYWFVTSFILYCYAGEKVPWLMVHMILPLILLGGWYLGKKIDEKKYLVPILVIPLIVLTLNATCLANFRYSAIDPLKNYKNAELIAYVQTTYDVPRMAHQIETLKPKNPNFSILLTGESTWPLTWYLRHIPAVYYGDTIEMQDSNFTVIITNAQDFETDFQMLGQAYTYQKYQLRAWWPEPSLPKDIGLYSALRYLFKEATVSQLARYFLTRQTFWPGGSTDVVMWVKRE